MAELKPGAGTGGRRAEDQGGPGQDFLTGPLGCLTLKQGLIKLGGGYAKTRARESKPTGGGQTTERQLQSPDALRSEGGGRRAASRLAVQRADRRPGEDPGHPEWDCGHGGEVKGESGSPRNRRSPPERSTYDHPYSNPKRGVLSRGAPCLELNAPSAAGCISGGGSGASLVQLREEARVHLRCGHLGRPRAVLL